MAEAILNLLIQKLTGAAVKETLFLYGAKSKLDSLQHELHWIQAFLKDAESKRKSDERVKVWISEVREVAYRIEDVIDTFIAEVDSHNWSGKLKVLNRVLKNPMKLPIVHSLICEMDNIHKRLHEIKECTEKYSIINLLGDSGSSSSLSRHVILPDEDDPDVIGLHKDKENIVNLLLDPNIRERCVVSIIGQGGLGKTTLARKAYNSNKVKEEFKFRLWLSISQQFRLIDLLKTILEKIRPLKEDEKILIKKEDAVSQQRAREYFIIELNVCLKNIRYLIIIDDVWTENFWFQVKEALPDVKNGSRVLVTTRFCDTIRKADPTCVLHEYELGCLSEEQSQQLLLKKAFRGQDPKTYLSNLSDLPKRFAIKCGFLPLALVVLGGLLSRQLPTYISWHMVFKKFSWHIDDGMKCIEILQASYEDLPSHLKPCFMYFALFPEDYNIKVKSLIRMWVAEGFIFDEVSRTMEETAEDYLEELVHRSMIQVSSRSCNGSIKYCGIHDLLRDVAIHKAMENGFLKIISNQDGMCSFSSMRRLSLQDDYNCDDIRKYYPGSNLRSLFYFGDYLPNLSGCKLLKVLKGRDSKLDHVGTRIIKGGFFANLPQLRYLETTKLIFHRAWYQYSYSIYRQFWTSISLMRNLQTLNIPVMPMKSSTYNILDCIWDIKTPRHVIVSPMYYGPPPIADLTNLQTLKTVRVRVEWITQGWPKMPNIRVLKLFGFTYGYQKQFHTFLSRLHHLTSLLICGDYENEMIDMSTLPCYNFLQTLYMVGKWTANTITASSFPIYLIKIQLENSEIREDPMPVLEKLASLRTLVLHHNAYSGRQLYCSTGGFPNLQVLTIEYLELEEWNAEEGAMPMLKEINIYRCHNLKIIPELQQMTSLSKLSVSGVSSDLCQSLREEKSHKVGDGQFIHFDFVDSFGFAASFEEHIVAMLCTI